MYVHVYSFFVDQSLRNITVLFAGHNTAFLTLDWNLMPTFGYCLRKEVGTFSNYDKNKINFILLVF